MSQVPTIQQSTQHVQEPENLLFTWIDLTECSQYPFLEFLKRKQCTLHPRNSSTYYVIFPRGTRIEECQPPYRSEGEQYCTVTFPDGVQILERSILPGEGCYLYGNPFE